MAISQCQCVWLPTDDSIVSVTGQQCNNVHLKLLWRLKMVMFSQSSVVQNNRLNSVCLSALDCKGITACLWQHFFCNILLLSETIASPTCFHEALPEKELVVPMWSRPEEWQMYRSALYVHRVFLYISRWFLAGTHGSVRSVGVHVWWMWTLGKRRDWLGHVPPLSLGHSGDTQVNGGDTLQLIASIWMKPCDSSLVRKGTHKVNCPAPEC